MICSNYVKKLKKTKNKMQYDCVVQEVEEKMVHLPHILSTNMVLIP